MSKKAAEHHNQAAEHYAHAAKHHREAGILHQSDEHERAAHHVLLARAHAVQAAEHAEFAAKAHIEEHGKTGPSGAWRTVTRAED
jgi:hypothetical protein